jgi:type III secretion system TyeA family effector delivery regulator
MTSDAPTATAPAEPDPVAVVAFLSGVRGILRRLPVQTFLDNEARNIALQAAQDALDEAIAKEELAAESNP